MYSSSKMLRVINLMHLGYKQVLKTQILVKTVYLSIKNSLFEYKKNMKKRLQP